MPPSRCRHCQIHLLRLLPAPPRAAGRYPRYGTAATAAAAASTTAGSRAVPAVRYHTYSCHCRRCCQPHRGQPGGTRDAVQLPLPPLWRGDSGVTAAIGNPGCTSGYDNQQTHTATTGDHIANTASLLSERIIHSVSAPSPESPFFVLTTSQKPTTLYLHTSLYFSDTRILRPVEPVGPDH